jgi:hypothetical protein
VKQIEALEKSLAQRRVEIEALEANPRWSDSLTHESAAEIRAIGFRLNKKKFLQQMTRNAEAAVALLAEMKQSERGRSSSMSPASEESIQAT